MHSIILTVHNKGWLIDKVIQGIKDNTVGEYELIVVVDGCTDDSEEVVRNNVQDLKNYTVLFAPNVFETKANNIGLREAVGDKVIIVQDDMIIKEFGWNMRMEKPFIAFNDVFAVTARTAHNWVRNPYSKHYGMKDDLDNCWCDIVLHTDHAQRENTPRDIFAVRNSVNRGPLMMHHADLNQMGYFDEAFEPQDMDDHDLMHRVYKELNKVCGCYWIDFESEDAWGGTRVSGEPAPWLYKAHHKNSKIFYDRHRDLINSPNHNEDRKLK